MASKMRTTALFGALSVCAAFAGGDLQAAESTATLGVSAQVPNSCDVGSDGRTARVLCSHPAGVVLTLTGAPPMEMPLAGAQPTMIILPAAEPGSEPMLVIAY